MKKLSKVLMAVVAVVFCASASAAKPKFPLLPTTPYDTIIDGQKVALYTIKKGKVAAQIINYGGFVVGLYAPDKNGEYAKLYSNQFAGICGQIIRVDQFIAVEKFER